VRVTKRLSNPFQYGICILQYFVIPKSQHTVASSLEEGRSSLISSSLHYVLTAVQFDNQYTLHTAKISNISSDRMLPAKLRATELPRS
jgi:hypothetical protein